MAPNSKPDEPNQRGSSVAGEEPSRTWVVAGAFGALGTVVSSVGQKFSDLPRPEHHDPPKIDCFKGRQSPSQSMDEHRGLSVAGEEPSRTWYGSFTWAVVGGFGALGTVLSSVEENIPGRDRWKNIGRFGFEKVSDLPRPDHHDPSKIDFLKDTQSPSQSKYEHHGGASNAENAREGWSSWINGPMASAGQYLYGHGINSASSVASTWETMHESGRVTSGRAINVVRVDMANPNGWVWSGLRVADAVAPELLGQSYKLTKKGVDAVYKEWKTREGMVKENDQDIRTESTNTSINSSQNHGSMGEERQGCPDGEGLQAPEHCFRDAAGATKEQTSSDLANDNGLVGRRVKENDQDIRIESTNTSINSSRNHMEAWMRNVKGVLMVKDFKPLEHCSVNGAGSTEE